MGEKVVFNGPLQQDGAAYIREYRVVEMFKDLTASLLVYRPPDPYQFLIDSLVKFQTQWKSFGAKGVLFEQGTAVDSWAIARGTSPDFSGHVVPTPSVTRTQASPGGILNRASSAGPRTTQTRAPSPGAEMGKGRYTARGTRPVKRPSSALGMSAIKSRMSQVGRSMDLNTSLAVASPDYGKASSVLTPEWAGDALSPIPKRPWSAEPRLSPRFATTGARSPSPDASARKEPAGDRHVVVLVEDTSQHPMAASEVRGAMGLAPSDARGHELKVWSPSSSDWLPFKDETDAVSHTMYGLFPPGFAHRVPSGLVANCVIELMHRLAGNRIAAVLPVREVRVTFGMPDYEETLNEDFRQRLVREEELEKTHTRRAVVGVIEERDAAGKDRDERLRLDVERRKAELEEERRRWERDDELVRLKQAHVTTLAQLDSAQKAEKDAEERKRRMEELAQKADVEKERWHKAYLERQAGEEAAKKETENLARDKKSDEERLQALLEQERDAKRRMREAMDRLEEEQAAERRRLQTELSAEQELKKRLLEEKDEVAIERAKETKKQKEERDKLQGEATKLRIQLGMAEEARLQFAEEATKESAKKLSEQRSETDRLQKLLGEKTLAWEDAEQRAAAAVAELQSRLAAEERAREIEDDAREKLMALKAQLGLAVATVTGGGLSGARVVTVKEHGAADRAGLKEGDVVLQVGPVPTPTRAEFINVLGAAFAGEESDFHIVRGGQRLTMPVRFGAVGVEEPDLMTLRSSAGATWLQRRERGFHKLAEAVAARPPSASAEGAAH